MEARKPESADLGRREQLEQLRAEREAARSAADRAREQAKARAQRSGRLFWSRQFDAGPAAGGVRYATSTGEVATFRPGVVDLVNLSGHQFDFRVRMSNGADLDGDEVRAPQSGLQPVVEELTILRRPRGERVTAEAARGLRVGEVVEIAVAVLTVIEGEKRISHGSAKTMLRRKPAATRAQRSARDVEVVAEAIRLADSRKGAVRFEVVKRALSERWQDDPSRWSSSPSDRWVGELIRRAIEEHDLPAGRRGRPPSRA